MKRNGLTVVFLLSYVTVLYGLACENELDCDLDECCVAVYPVQIIGSGVCQKLGRAGSPCSDTDAQLANFGGKYLLRCPCKTGSDCMPTGRYREYGYGTSYQSFLSQKCVRYMSPQRFFSSFNNSTNGV